MKTILTKKITWIVYVMLLAACANQSHIKHTSNLQTDVDEIREQYNFPGMTVAYVFKNGTSGSVSSGLADVEAKVSVTENTRMLGASTGKSFVAALTLALAQEKRLVLDEPVSKWLAKYEWFDRLPNHKSITARHLLSHSAGLPDHVHMQKFHDAFASTWQTPKNQFPPQRLVEFILDEPAKFPAGNGWAYSDTGYILLGMVLEEVTGRPVYVEIKERFLNPLGLTNTIASDQRDLNKLAAGYINPDNPFRLPAKTLDENGHLHFHPAVEWTGGGLATTSSDLAHWGSALFSGKAMHGDYLSELLTGVPINSADADARYGAGVVISTDEHFGTVYGHTGWIPGYVSSFRYYQNSGVTIAFQINTDIGIIDSDENVLKNIEDRLKQILDRKIK